MTLLAYTLYSMLGEKLLGFERCDASEIFCSFAGARRASVLTGDRIAIDFSRKAHNPILRDVPWQRLPRSLSWLNGADLELKFR